jgi:hypothetical protein
MTCLRLFRHEPVTSPGNRVHISGVDRISVWGGRHLFLAPGRESGGEGGEREAGVFRHVEADELSPDPLPTAISTIPTFP